MSNNKKLTVDHPLTDDELYVQYQGQNGHQQAYLCLNLKNCTVYPYVDLNIGTNSITWKEYRNIEISFKIEPLNIYGFKLLIDEIIDDLQIIAENCTYEYLGLDSSCELNGVAIDTRDNLEFKIEEFCSNCNHHEIYTVWQAGDWLAETDITNLISSTTTDKEISTIATRLENEASADGCNVEGIEEYLLSQRDEIEEETE